MNDTEIHNIRQCYLVAPDDELDEAILALGIIGPPRWAVLRKTHLSPSYAEPISGHLSSAAHPLVITGPGGDFTKEHYGVLAGPIHDSPARQPSRAATAASAGRVLFTKLGLLLKRAYRRHK